MMNRLYRSTCISMVFALAWLGGSAADEAPSRLADLKQRYTPDQLRSDDRLLAEFAAIHAAEKGLAPAWSASSVDRVLEQEPRWAQRLTADQSPVPPEHVAGLHDLIVAKNGLSKDLVFKQVWPKVIAEGLSPAEVVTKHEIEGVDEGAVIEATDKAWAENPKIVQDLLGGKKKAQGAIVGAVMKALKGKASPQVINRRIAELLEGERANQ